MKKQRPTTTKKTKPPKPLKAEPYVPVTQAAKEVTAELGHRLDNYETLKAPRKRARRKKDRAARQRAKESWIGALIAAETSKLPGVRVSLKKGRKGGRYRDDMTTSVAQEVLNQMMAPEMAMAVLVEKGRRSVGFRGSGKQSVVKAGTALVRQIESRGLTLWDVDRDYEGQEIILLKETRVSRDPADLVDYLETDETVRLRTQVRLINAWLRSADIELIQDTSQADFIIDPRRRFLRRVFTRGSFESGGRLFGGFWQPMGKEQRLESILISGEPIVGLDFQEIGPSLLHWMAGAPPVGHDPYPTGPFLSRSSEEPVRLRRRVVKRLFGCLQFDMDVRDRWPRGMAEAGRGVPVQTVVQAILAANPAIAHLLQVGAGHTVQFHESQVLVEILSRCMVQGIVALPVHDCVYVAESAEAVAMGIMSQVYEEYTGHTARISVERLDD